jgi:hypothetical protein
MGVNNQKYGEEMERQLAAGLDLEAAHKIAMDKWSTPNLATKPAAVTAKKPIQAEATPEQKVIIKGRLDKQYPQMKDNWAATLKKNVQKELHPETKRTKDVSSQLKDSGLTDEEIKKLK